MARECIVSGVTGTRHPTPRPRGRWAPSPTGRLHVGNARTALAAWLSVRSRGGTFVWRLEDLDPPRVLQGAAEAAREDLAWLGIDWDEGPDLAGGGGPVGPYVQSERHALYDAALDRLAAAGRLFPCNRSRKDLQALASAPHGPSEAAPYPASLRPRSLPDDWLATHRRACTAAAGSPHAALRFRVDDRPVTFEDAVFGPLTERVDRTVGDFVLQRRDGLYAYQLAAVADDLAMEIDEVVRGEDLLSSTARQIQLLCALGGTAPAYAHVPLVVGADGEKLSKRDEALTLRSLRAAGIRPEALVGWMGASLGLLDRPEPRRPADLVERFAWRRVPREAVRVPEGLNRYPGPA
jgi:glutamyl-tRNA synthetase